MIDIYVTLHNIRCPTKKGHPLRRGCLHFYYKRVLNVFACSLCYNPVPVPVTHLLHNSYDSYTYYTIRSGKLIVIWLHMCTCVANGGLGLYIGGDYNLHLKSYVACTICQQTSCHGNTWDDVVTLDMRTRIRPADWCAATRSLPADRKPGSWPLAVGPERSPGTDVFVNVRINSRLREMLNVMFSDACDRTKDLWINSEYIMWCQPNGHDTVWLITRMLRLKGCRPGRWEFVHVRLYKL